MVLFNDFYLIRFICWQIVIWFQVTNVNSKQGFPLRVKVELGVMAIKEYLTLTKVPELEFFIRYNFGVGECLNFQLRKDTHLSIFYYPE